MHSSSIANALGAPPGTPRVSPTLMPLRNPISTWDTEYTWQRAANPLFSSSAVSTQPAIPVATGSNKAPVFLVRPGRPFNNEIATYPSHLRREQGPEGAPPYSYCVRLCHSATYSALALLPSCLSCRLVTLVRQDPRTPWGRGRPFPPAFAPAFKGTQSVAIAAANAGSGVTGKADRNNALTMDLAGAATARGAVARTDDAISPGSRPASARPATAASPRRPPIAFSRAPVVGTAESPLYAAGYPQRLRGDARQAGGGTPAMAMLSYHDGGRTRRFGSPQAWLTSYMAMNVEAHGTDAFK
jgi:hypothetical protein